MNREKRSDLAPAFGPTQNGCLLRLQHAVQALALPAKGQLSLFPDFVSVADELALDFDAWWQCVQETPSISLSADQRAACNALDQQLGTMSAAHDPALWTITALETGDTWAEVRRLGQQTLSVFGWPHEPPPSYASEYVRG